MPRLLIVADEFRELRSQEPEFMQSLVSAATIGRSLGINLVLATQNPSGIVDDQIRANTNFAICLKVQNAFGQPRYAGHIGRGAPVAGRSCLRQGRRQ